MCIRDSCPGAGVPGSAQRNAVVCFTGKAVAGFLPIMDEPTSLDPQIADSNSEKLVAANCYEGLVRIMADGTIGTVSYTHLDVYKRQE